MVNVKTRVLIISDDLTCAKYFEPMKERFGYLIAMVSSLRSAEANVDYNPTYDKIIIDLPIDVPAHFRFCQRIRNRVSPDTTFYLTARRMDSKFASKLMQSGQVLPLAAPLTEPQMLHDELNKKPPSGKPFSYDVNIINCFIKATSEVVEYYTGEAPKLEKPRLKKDKLAAPGFVTGLTTIKGSTLYGSTSLTCDKNFINYLATRVIGISRSRARKDEAVITQVTKEMCDQIFGKARVLLQELGYDFDITLPVVALSNDPPVCHTAINPVMTIPFYMSRKTFCIEFCLEFAMDQAAS